MRRYKYSDTLENLLTKLENILGRNFLVDIYEGQRHDVGAAESQSDWHTPNFVEIKSIQVRTRGNTHNVHLATIVLYGKVLLYDNSGPVYASQKEIEDAIAKICK